MAESHTGNPWPWLLLRAQKERIIDRLTGKRGIDPDVLLIEPPKETPERIIGWFITQIYPWLCLTLLWGAVLFEEQEWQPILILIVFYPLAMFFGVVFREKIEGYERKKAVQEAILTALFFPFFLVQRTLDLIPVALWYHPRMQFRAEQEEREKEQQEQEEKAARERGFRIQNAHWPQPVLKCLRNGCTETHMEPTNPLFGTSGFQCPTCRRTAYVQRKKTLEPWTDVGHAWPILKQAAVHAEKLARYSIFAGFFGLIGGAALLWNPLIRLGGAVTCIGFVFAFLNGALLYVSEMLPEKPPKNNLIVAGFRACITSIILVFFLALTTIPLVPVVYNDPAGYLEQDFLPRIQTELIPGIQNAIDTGVWPTAPPPEPTNPEDSATAMLWFSASFLFVSAFEAVVWFTSRARRKQLEPLSKRQTAPSTPSTPPKHLH